jgi:uncharacterized protein
MLCHYQSDQLQYVVDIIVKAALPDKVFLLGATQCVHTEDTIFCQPPVMLQQITHYYLLVLTKVNDNRCFDILQDIIENRCAHATPVTVIIEATHIFNEWIEAGHPFACRIATAGSLLYDVGEVVLSKAGFSDSQIMAPNQEKEFSRWDSHVTEFLAGSQLYRERKQLGLAAFLLHQAAEHACTILYKLFTGYRAGTHNLDKLFRYCKPLSSALTLLFPRNSQKEHHLFQLLQKAYVHARYRDDYVITEKELVLLTERVKKLQVIMREAAKERNVLLFA